MLLVSGNTELAKKLLGWKSRVVIDHKVGENLCYNMTIVFYDNKIELPIQVEIILYPPSLSHEEKS